MHSDNIVKTLDSGQNRFELCHQAFKAIRKLHKPSDRIQDTASDALGRLAGVAQREAPIGPENATAAGPEVTQERIVIAPQAGAPRSEPVAEDISSGGVSVLVPAEFASSATGRLVPRP
ncbi:MAG: hypothetical protein ABSD96_19385 [Candidatus Korobacteraceae bacterium]